MRTPEGNQEASEEASQLRVPGRRHSMWEDMKVRERERALLAECISFLLLL